MGEERRGVVRATDGELEILFLQFDPDHPPFVFQCRHRRGAATEERIEDEVAITRLGEDAACDESDGLLRRMFA